MIVTVVVDAVVGVGVAGVVGVAVDVVVALTSRIKNLTRQSRCCFSQLGQKYNQQIKAFARPVKPRN